MTKVSSNSTLYPVAHVAEAAGISRMTVHNWLDAGLVTHRFDLAGRAVFTQSERDEIVRLARERAEARDGLRLSKEEA